VRAAARTLRRLLHATLGAALLGVAGTASAQASSAVLQPLARLDASVARTTAVHLGVGAGAPLGLYARLDGVIAGGAVVAPGRDAAASVRAEVIARFLLDPFREYRRGGYLGGGVGWRADRGRRGSVAVLAVIGVEGAARGGLAPAIELGLGGGVRLGVVLRHARADSR
jgi:hypothetical protein